MTGRAPLHLNRRRFAFGIACAAGVATSNSFAQGSESVRLIVPFPPGGGTDVLGRVLAIRMAEHLKQSIFIDNRPGAGGALGTELVAKAPKDGRTLLFAGLVPAPKVYGDQSLFDQLSAVSIVARSPYLLVVKPDLPVGTLADLVKLAHSKPGALNFGTPGDATPHHIGMEMFNTTAKTDILAVPYKGSGPMINDVVGGQIDGTFATVSAVEGLVANGRLKPIAVTSPERLPSMPNVPTVAESGFPGFRADIGFAVYAPAGTPAPVLARLNEAVRASLKDREFLDKLTAQGYVPSPSTPQEQAVAAAKEMEFVRGLIKAGKVKLAL